MKEFNIPLVRVTKEFTFDSAHFLKNYVGPCANMHGHTYKLQVTLEGTLNDTGFVLDFKKLKDLVKRTVVDRLDHHVLNNELEFNTTAENMVVWMYDTLNKELELDTTSVVSVKLWETPTSFAEFSGKYL